MWIFVGGEMGRILEALRKGKSNYNIIYEKKFIK